MFLYIREMTTKASNVHEHFFTLKKYIVSLTASDHFFQCQSSAVNQAWFDQILSNLICNSIHRSFWLLSVHSIQVTHCTWVIPKSKKILFWWETWIKEICCKEPECRWCPAIRVLFSGNYQNILHRRHWRHWCFLWRSVRLRRMLDDILVGLCSRGHNRLFCHNWNFSTVDQWSPADTRKITCTKKLGEWLTK